jgi:hypothetical protein
MEGMDRGDKDGRRAFGNGTLWGQSKDPLWRTGAPGGGLEKTDDSRLEKLLNNGSL